VGTLLAQLERRSGAVALDLVQAVLAVSRLPYGRPDDRSAAGVLREGRGTCSTKHMLVADLVDENWPDRDARLWHRVARVTPDLAVSLWGRHAAAWVPADGLVDVHTFATITVDRTDVIVDATFPVDDWDGMTDMTLACGPGEDHPAGHDVLRTKAQLVERWCDPAVREPFIRSLARAVTPQPSVPGSAGRPVPVE
jgi:hypothetical protein